jgi:hypothetical protein
MPHQVRPTPPSPSPRHTQRRSPTSSTP